MPLKVSHGIGAWIKDFQKSDAPQFKGKSDKERRDQAIAAYLSAKRDQKEAKEPPPFEGPYKKKKSVVPGKHGEGPSTAKHLAKMGMKQAEKKPVKESDAAWAAAKEKEKMDRLKPSDQDKIAKIRAMLAKEKKPMKEATTFEVDIEGLPKMYIKDKSPGAVKAKLRGIVKQPSMIQGVDRVTDAEMKKTYRDKAQGRDEEEMDEGTSSLKPGWMLKADPKLGAAVKAKQDLAKKRQATYGKPEAGKSVKEEVNEISGELAQRYHDKAVKAPAPKDKKDPLKHTIKRFASMQKAQDIIHKSELKRIGGQK